VVALPERRVAEVQEGQAGARPDARAPLDGQVLFQERVGRRVLPLPDGEAAEGAQPGREPMRFAQGPGRAQRLLEEAPRGGRVAWMDATDQRSAYRCLPLLIANQAGWLLLNSHTLRVTWDGGNGLEALRLEYVTGLPPYPAASHFGYGILTWGVPYVFRTPPGYNLLARGPANWPKEEAVAPDTALRTCAPRRARTGRRGRFSARRRSAPYLGGLLVGPSGDPVTAMRTISCRSTRGTVAVTRPAPRSTGTEACETSSAARRAPPRMSRSSIERRTAPVGCGAATGRPRAPV
jgi:hypothetical protein